MLWNRLATVVDGRTLTVLGERILDARAFSVSTDGGQAAFLASNKVTLCSLTSNCESRPQHDVSALSPSDLELSPDGRFLVVIGDASGVEASRPLALFNTTPWEERKVSTVDHSIHWP